MSDSAMNKLTEDAREVVKQGQNIRAGLRKLTLAALHRGRLEAAESKKVVQAVLQGALQGLGSHGEKSRLAMGEAWAGVDEALAKSAEATKLALEEAAGRLSEFAKHDLERAVGELRTIEQMLLDTLQQTAEQSTAEAREILRGLLQHAKTGGTAAGTSAANAISTLEQKLGRTLHEITTAGGHAALDGGTKLAESAAKFLAGIAEALDTQADKLRKDK